MNIEECDGHSPQTYSYLCKKEETNAKDVVNINDEYQLQPLSWLKLKSLILFSAVRFEEIRTFLCKHTLRANWAHPADRTYSLLLETVSLGTHMYIAGSKHAP